MWLHCYSHIIHKTGVGHLLDVDARRLLYSSQHLVQSSLHQILNVDKSTPNVAQVTKWFSSWARIPKAEKQLDKIKFKKVQKKRFDAGWNHKIAWKFGFQQKVQGFQYTKRIWSHCVKVHLTKKQKTEISSVLVLDLVGPSHTINVHPDLVGDMRR